MNALQKRIIQLTVIIAAGCSLIWLLPASGEMRPSRLARHLPMEFAEYSGERVAITGRELQILAADTEFERMSYKVSSSPSIPNIEVSVVFSGRDMNNSIHRPEVCMHAQGWNFEKLATVTVKGALPDGKDIKFREIVCKRKAFDPKTNEPIMLPNGEQFYMMRVQYYTFLGHSMITENHYRRTVEDMKDRLLKGYDQRWAYLTVSMPVTGAWADQGVANGAITYNQTETEELLADFIRKIAPLVIDVDRS